MANRNTTIPVATAIPGTRAVEVAFLAADYVPDISASLGQLITVHIGISGANDSIIQYTLDGGSTFHSFLNEELVKNTAGLEKQITLRSGDSVNFKALSAITLDFCRVDLV